MRHALKIFYLGDFEGFQRQPNKETIEGHLIRALKEAGLIEDIKAARYISAGRTDKGVHAVGQIIAISTLKSPVLPAINAFLPKNIIVWASKSVNEEFNPRFDALSRYYRYYTYYSGEDISLLKEGAKILEGVHDFKFFCKKQPEKNTIRDIFQLQIEKLESFLVFHIRANAFLWQMVRRIVDCLLKTGRAQWELQDLKDLIDGHSKSNIFTEPRSIHGLNALILWNIEYPFQFEIDSKSLDKVKEVIHNYLSEFSLKEYYFKQFDEFFGLID